MTLIIVSFLFMSRLYLWSFSASLTHHVPTHSHTHSQTFISLIFLYVAFLAPAIAFGGLMEEVTGNQIGGTETLLMTGLSGTFYGLAACQPLTILAFTGPILLFEEVVFSVSWSLSQHQYFSVCHHCVIGHVLEHFLLTDHSPHSITYLLTHSKKTSLSHIHTHTPSLFLSSSHLLYLPLLHINTFSFTRTISLFLSSLSSLTYPTWSGGQ